ncbi:MAG TPA: peptidyl-prolyl cis-trans isomerase [Thermoanaerobaculia bacterium]|jgi:peptidyl-prolyl cis-trans isomerase D|nr:peptidyl-prolyl cis-trans isomerase [Thermoanaerobaculia bacterium]
MLKVLRENIKYLSWILWLIVIVFVLAIFLDFGRVPSSGASDEAAAATVGGEHVTRAEVRRQYDLLEGQYRQIYGEQFTPELAERLGLPLQALNGAVNQKVLLAEAKRMGLAPTDKDLQKAILQIPGMKDDKGNFVGSDVYANVIRRGYQMTPGDFERMARDQIALERLNQVLRGTIYVSDAEIEQSYREQTEKAEIRYVLMPSNRFLQGQEIPAAEVASYFAAHKEEYRLPEQRDLAFLLVDDGKMMGQAQIPDAEVKAYYDAHLADYSHEAEVQARHILALVNDQQNEAAAKAKIEAAQARIKAGADFAKVATEVSEDTGSKVQGGELGWFPKGRMDASFSEAAFAAAPGQVVGPIRSQYGFHLIQVEGRRPAGSTPMDEVKSQIVFQLSGERSKKASESKAKQIAERLAKDKPKGPEALAELAGQDATLTYTASARFGRQEPIPGLGVAPEVASSAFSLAKGGVTPALQVPRGWVIGYVKDVLPPRLPELTEVEPKVRLAAAREKQSRMAVEELARARQKLDGGETLDQVAAGLGVKVVDSPEFGATGQIPGLGNNPQLAKAALALQPGQVGGPLPDPQGAILFQVKSKKAFDPVEFAKQKDTTRESLGREKTIRLLQALIEKKRQEIGVNFSRSYLLTLGIDPDQAAAAKS